MFGYLLEVFGLVGRKVFLCHKKSSASVVNRFVLHANQQLDTLLFRT